MSGSEITPDPIQMPQSRAGRLVIGDALRMDFARLDPLDRSEVLALAGPPFAPAAPDAVADRLARLFPQPAVMTFASGDLALRLTLSTLLSPGDDVIVDAGAGSAMFETVLQTSAHLYRCPPGSVEGVERRLSRLSRSRRTGRTFVLVPAVARMSSVVADLDELCRLCESYRATLVVDMSQDFGTMGEGGLGVGEAQGCLSRIDVVLGDLFGLCGTAGGFAAFRDPALGDRLALPGKAQPPSPDTAAIILTVLDLVDSVEGGRRRRLLQGASLRLRNHLMADHLPIMGQPSHVVPLRLQPSLARSLTAIAASAGVNLPLVQAPDVAGHAPRWLIQLNAGHGPAVIDDLAGILHDKIRAGDRRQSEPVP